MFERLELHNFQCHKTLSLELDKITTLVGPSDSGKTAVLRAIDWICFNRGRPTLLLRRGAQDVSATLQVDGHRVSRTTMGNAYHLDQAHFTTIGKNIPPEVSAFLKMSEDNIQRQHDYLFWFSHTGSGLVSDLNRVVDLTRLESWVRTGVAKERSFKEKVNYLLKRTNELKEEYASLEKYRVIDAELADLEVSEAELSAAKEKQNQLETVLLQLNSSTGTISRLRDFGTDLHELTSHCEELVDAQDRQATLQKTLKSLVYSKTKEHRLRELIKSRIDFESLFSLQSRMSALSHLLSEHKSSNTVSLAAFREDLTGLIGDWGLIIEDMARKNSLATLLRVLCPISISPVPIMDCLTNCQKLVVDYEALGQLTKEYAGYEKSRVLFMQEKEQIESEFREKSGGLCPVCGRLLDTCI